MDGVTIQCSFSAGGLIGALHRCVFPCRLKIKQDAAAQWWIGNAAQDRDVHSCHSVPDRSLDRNTGSPQGSKFARPTAPKQGYVYRRMRTSLNLLCFLCKACQRTHFSLLFLWWRCGNWGCSDDSGWLDEVTPLFTLINHFDGCDSFELDFLLWQNVRKQKQVYFTVFFLFRC